MESNIVCANNFTTFGRKIKKEEIMKKILLILLTINVLCFSSYSFADTYVNGYYRKDGTYVDGHYRGYEYIYMATSLY